MKATIITVLALVVFASAASASDLDRVIDCMRHNSCKHVIASQTYAKPFDGKQVVFVEGGKRYTLYWSGDWNNVEWRPRPKDEQMLSIWVRPNGTHGPKLKDGFTDHRLDGRVDVGFLRATPNQSGKLFDTGEPLGERPEGLEFREYWQGRYDEAIAAAARRLL